MVRGKDVHEGKNDEEEHLCLFRNVDIYCIFVGVSQNGALLPLSGGRAPY